MPQARQTPRPRRRPRRKPDEPKEEQAAKPDEPKEEQAEQSSNAAEEDHEDEAEDQEPEDHGEDGGVNETVVAELKNAIREAALEVLRPAARQATSSAAKYAVSQGPKLVTKNVLPAIVKRGGAGGIAQEALSKGGEALSNAGGVGGLVGKAVPKLGGGKGGGEASGWGRNRRMPVQQEVFVSVPVRRAYTGWTEYKRWSEYMHRANQSDVDVDEDKIRVKVTEKMWGFTRPFSAEVISQRPDEHIKWNSEEGTKHTGIINFHEVGPRLTLIEVSIDHSPSGLIEKISRGARFDKRAIRADLHRFKAWIEMIEDEDIEGWRGTVEDGSIVRTHEEAMEEEQREEQEGGGEEGAEEGEEPEGEYDEEEPEGEYDEEEDQAEPEPEEEPEEEAPPPRRRRSSRAPAASGGQRRRRSSGRS